MTFASLRALHALIGAAIDDIERVYVDASSNAYSSTIVIPSPIVTNIHPSSPVTRRQQPFSPARSSASSSSSRTLASPVVPPVSPTFRPSTPPPPSLDYPSLDVPAYPLPATPSTPLIPSSTRITPHHRQNYTPYTNHDAKHLDPEELAQDPRALAASARIVAACAQLSATVQRPFLTLCDAAMGYHLPACLRFLEASHTVEILREAGSSGLHVSQLASRISSLIPGEPWVDPAKLGHILRLLATHHIGREARPDVFVNNRVSAELDTGWATEELRVRPEEKYEGTNGSAAFVGLCTDELFKASAYLTDCFLPSVLQLPELNFTASFPPSPKDVQNPTTDLQDHENCALNPSDPMHAPFNLAFRTGTRYFEWLERAGNEHRLRRFGRAMTGSKGMEGAGGVVHGFPWGTLEPGGVVVDVGGGIGSVSMVLAEKYEGLRFLVQDRPQVVELGEAEWRARCPDMLDSGRVVFQAHDFFEPQPPWPDALRKHTSRDQGQDQDQKSRREEVSVFLLRVITHDWPDERVLKILKHLRTSASPRTKLLIADHLLPLACIDEDEGEEAGKRNNWGQTEWEEGRPGRPGGSIPGTIRTLASEGSPLLPNLGKANAIAYWLDMTMHVTFSARERTLREMTGLVRRAGWEVKSVTRSAGTVFGYVVAEPVAPTPATNSEPAEPRQANKEMNNKHTCVRETVPLPVPLAPKPVSLPVASETTQTTSLLLPSPLILLKEPEPKNKISFPKLRAKRSSGVSQPESSPTVSFTPANVAVESRSSPEGEELWRHALQAPFWHMSPGETGIGIGDASASPSLSLSPGSDQYTDDAGSRDGMGGWTWTLGPDADATLTTRAGPSVGVRSGDEAGRGDVSLSPGSNSHVASTTSPGFSLGLGLKKMRSKTHLRRVLSQVEMRMGSSRDARGRANAGPEAGEEGSSEKRPRSVSRPRWRSRSGEGEVEAEVPPVPPVPPASRFPGVPSVLERMRWRQRQVA